MLLSSTFFFFNLDKQTHHRTWYLTSEMVAKRAWWCNMEVQGKCFPIVQLQPVGNRMGELGRYNAFLFFFHGWLLRPSRCVGWVTCSAPGSMAVCKAVSSLVVYNYILLHIFPYLISPFLTLATLGYTFQIKCQNVHSPFQLFSPESKLNNFLNLKLHLSLTKRQG